MEQVFIGIHPHAIDSQRRLAIPRDWRRGGEESEIFYVLPGRDQIIQILPKEDFEREILEKARKVSFANAKQSRALANIGARAARCVTDRQGRIRLTPELMAHAGLTDQAVMVGSFGTIQVMRPDVWETHGMDTDEVLDQIENIQQIGEL